jgi:BlaI family transcriptional regulator, penicillinase repressor
MPRFTPGEMRVMQLLWAHGELKPAELQSLYPEPIKNPALRSFLKILVEKGHVTRRKVGKAYLYKAKTPRQRAFSTMLADLVETFCAGSVEQLLLALVRKEKLSEQDLLELKRLADEPSAGEGRRSEPTSRERRTQP